MPTAITATAQARINQLIAGELNANAPQVAAAVALLDEGATVPFIARYRKEVTGNLDDTQLRTLEERLLYLRELEERRVAITASIQEQGKLTPELEAYFVEATDAYKNMQVLGSQRTLQFGGEQLLSNHAKQFNCFDHTTKFIMSAVGPQGRRNLVAETNG